MGEIEQLKSNALTTLQKVKDMLGIAVDDTDQSRDNILVNMINAASAWFETQTGRKFKKQSYTEKCQGSDAQELCLRQYPITAVESITDTISGNAIESTEYSIGDSGYIGIVWKNSGWALQSYRYGLAYDPLYSRRYLTVIYTAGYVLPKDATTETPSTLPSDIESVIWEMVQQQYKLMQDGAFSLSSFSIADASWTWDKAPKQTWLDTVARYMRWA